MILKNRFNTCRIAGLLMAGALMPAISAFGGTEGVKMKVKFTWDAPAVKELSIRAETKSGLILKSINQENWATLEAAVKDMQAVFGNPLAMGKYGNRQPKTEEWTRGDTERRGFNRWKDGDFRGLFAVCVKENDEDKVVGYGVIGAGDLAGQAEIACALLPDYWSKGFASEMMTILLDDYIPLLKKFDFKFDGKSLEEIHATASDDNEFSVKVLEKAGFGPSKPNLEVTGAEQIKTAEQAATKEGATYYNMKDATGKLRTVRYIPRWNVFKWDFVKKV